MRQLHRVFTRKSVDRIRAETGYNPRKRVATAARLLLVVVEACLSGQTLGFQRIRAFFVRRFGEIRPRAFQLRFKSEAAVAFFKAALDQLVWAAIKAASVSLTGPLAVFDDVHVFDGTVQRVPPRGVRKGLKSTNKGQAASKWVVGYSLRTGIGFGAAGDSGKANELKLWRKLVGTMRARTLYLLDLGYFSRELFLESQQTGAYLLMRLKSKTKVRLLAEAAGTKLNPLPDWALSTYLTTVPTRKGTLIDLDVSWKQSGKKKPPLQLRLVGYSLGGKRSWRFYLTTVPRSMLSAEQVVQTYRLRWLVEFLFRLWKQESDFGRSFTADKNALQALTYGAMLSYALVRTIRLAAAVHQDVALESLRPLATLHAIRPYVSSLVDALWRPRSVRLQSLLEDISSTIVQLAYEPRPSRSRPRVALALGAVGG